MTPTRGDAPTPAVAAIRAAGIAHEVVEYGKAETIEQAAELRGVELAQVIKTLVVRLGEGRHLLVLVPGDRILDWAKLRRVVGVSRMTLAPPDEALEVTGYSPGAITALGTNRPLPVVLDASATGVVSVGGGAAGVAIHLDAGDLARATKATVAEVTRPG